MAAIALTGTAGLAQASEGRTVAPQSVSSIQQAEAQQAARTLLNGPLAPSLTDVERAEMTKIANGETAGASKWSAIRAALSKISGFGKAIGGKLSDFQKWWNGLAWWQKLPVTAISPTLTAVEIWNALH
ncbi:hypothetical protein [Streptomyces erythrochromogenes]|uniref:hypothetical protein n=1 Tax=Streptomyces erythrochromogenes TaxID=285574 RepID=UPI0036CFDB36